MVKNPPVKAGDLRDAGLISGSGRSPGEGHGNPLQYPCLENPMDRSLAGYSPRGRKAPDTTERLTPASPGVTASIAFDTIFFCTFRLS